MSKCRLIVPALAGFVLVGTLAHSAPVRAQNGNPYAKWHATHTSPPHSTSSRAYVSSHAYVPARGSMTRQAIADAMRRDVGKFAGVYVIFTYSYIKVAGNWAYAEAKPTSPNGKNSYGPVAALVKKQGSGWHVVDRVAGGDNFETNVAMERLKARKMGAPSTLFQR